MRLSPTVHRRGRTDKRKKVIDRATIEKVLDAADIVDVVKEFVTLRKAGVNYKGLCPFHNEKTPSFVVSPSKQLCKCFSCGKGGNVVHFLMEIEQMNYPEAIKWLGKKYGIEIQEKELTDEERAAQSERESMFVVNEWAKEYFQQTLRDNVDGVAHGMAYFRSRGFRDDIIRKFQLGYSLDERDALARAAISHGFKEEYLVKTGLCFKTDDGRLLDRYHGRVIFPVHTVSGKVVAFGGRILGSDKKLAKYVNSPESEIYSKSHELYGLYLAKSAIVRQGCCFLVEGYTDVISMHQSGIENVVASSGTSLTEGQIRLLHRFTNDITILYDGDSAGIKASLRGIDMLLAEGLHIKVLLLPDGDDPDSFARKHPGDEFRQYIESHQVDFIKFKTNLLLHDSEGDPIKRAALIQNVVNSIAAIPNNVERQLYVHECATLLSISEGLIVSEINKILRKRAYPSSEKETQEESTEEQSHLPDDNTRRDGEAERTEEKLLIAMIVRYGNLPMYSQDSPSPDSPHADEAASQERATVTVARYVTTDLERDNLQLRSALFRQILQEATEHAEEDGWEALPYFTRHPVSEVSALAAEVSEDSFELSSRQKESFTEDCFRLDEIIPRLLNDFKHSIVKERMENILQQLRTPGIAQDKARSEQLLRDYMELCSVERMFARVLGDRVVLK